ncbi:MAG: TIM barrel protein [Steroidobacteraceae bacterium]
MSDLKATTTLKRREFVMGAAAAASVWLLPARGIAAPRTSMNGVSVGAISYSFRGLPSSADKVLDYLLQTGLNTVELMGDAAEEYAGAPAGASMASPPQGRGGAEGMPEGPTSDGPSPMSAEEMAAMQALRATANAEKSKWRKTVDMRSYKKLRKLYDDAGVSIDILKLGDASWSDADIDYAYKVAEILGARGISFEMEDKAAKRMGVFAERHKMYNAMHNHAQYGQSSFSAEPLLAYSRYNMLNFDVGHYVGSTGKSPLEFIRQHHSRITHLHLKDRKTPANGGANVAWGTGDTPIGEVLRLLQAERYPIPAMIELEYKVPASSDILSEVKRCAEYCREQLG